MERLEVNGVDISNTSLLVGGVSQTLVGASNR